MVGGNSHVDFRECHHEGVASKGAAATRAKDHTFSKMRLVAERSISWAELHFWEKREVKTQGRRNLVDGFDL